ncbi:MAG: TRAP transporter substrate-binding protein [Burkholderiaceae bacterium]|nr:TRAP transporter substrate-binding protein [Burkholderiaceae bacterium]
MKTRHALAALAVAGACTIAAAQDKPMELKFSHWVPPTHAMQKTIVAWAQSIEKASNGSLRITIYPAQQLGKAFDHYDMTQSGIADFAYINVGYQAGRLPVANAIQLPFLVSDPANGSRAYDEWYRKYAAKDMPGVRMCLMFIHDPGTLHSKTRISSPEQIKGMKIRPAHAITADWMRSLGATTVTLSAPEAREALERGVADALTFPWESVYLFGIDKVTKFHIDAKLYTTGFAWIMNPAKYQAMSPAQRKVIDDHCTGEWAYRVGKEWGDFEAAGRERMKADKSHTIVTLTPAELAAWQKSAEPVYANWAAEVRKAGYDPDALLAELKATLAKYKAGL